MKKTWLVAVVAISVTVLGGILFWKFSEEDGARRPAALGASGEEVPLVWAGNWSEVKKYARGHVVQHEGVEYIAQTETATEDPAKATAACEVAEECDWTAMGAFEGSETEGGGAVGGAEDNTGEASDLPSSWPVSGYRLVSNTLVIQPIQTVQVSAVCPAGTYAVGGGYSITPYGYGDELYVVQSHASATGRAWLVEGFNRANSPRFLTTQAVCVHAEEGGGAGGG